jgi:hypothetical protein
MNIRRSKGIGSLKIAMFSSIAGAIIGSLLTFLIPRVIDYCSKPPVCINISAKEIIDWAQKVDNTLQLDILARKMYYGEYVQWEGVIESIGGLFGGPQLGFSYFIASFDNDKEVHTLTKGKKVVVRGVIQYISPLGLGDSPGFVSIGHCRIVKIVE